MDWITHLSPPELNSLLSSKNVIHKKIAIIYGYQNDDCTKLANHLLDFGTQLVYIYKAGLQEWAADFSLPMESLPNYQKLVYPRWINELQSGNLPQHSPGQNYGLFEVSSGENKEYRAGHIPGAIHFDLSVIENPATWNICPDDELFTYLSALGITDFSTSVLYGRDIMAAARAACILMYAGVEDVRILDGGFDAWINAGYSIETGSNQPVPVKTFGRNSPTHPEYIIGMNDLKATLSDHQGLLVSVRSWAEYIGETSGYNFIKPKGRIPGAIWGHSGSDPHHMQDFRNHDNTMRAYHEISKNWEKAGITENKRVIFYCGTGWRASEAFFYAYLMGWQHIAVFDGGWFEWSQHSLNPIASGVPGTPPNGSFMTDLPQI
jgi:thiosulfate/3-mercaptopyruvate sulfurtransferase